MIKEVQKDQAAILNKLGIQQLKPMQTAAHKAIQEESDVVLLSPTGSGKTLAFLLPILNFIKPEIHQIQILMVVPSRELALQLEQVIRNLGSGYKTNAVYGGRAGSRDKIELKHPPVILIGTPGRIADHLKNESFLTNAIHTLVLDEFDKSLEIGFENEMKYILDAIPGMQKKILTSATDKVGIPGYMRLKNTKILNFLDQEIPKITLKVIESPENARLNTLFDLLIHTGKSTGIIFCNLKESIQLISNFLNAKNIQHALFYGGLEQLDRERALIKFRNGSHRILLSTDLAARGIDVPALDFVVHFELPPKKDEFIHRNGRTARMEAKGIVYILQAKGEKLPDFITHAEIIKLDAHKGSVKNSNWETIYISGGRKDKISKGDIVGLFMKKGGLLMNEMGNIELKNECAYVSVVSDKYEMIIEKLNNSHLKKKKVRISLLAD